MGEQGDIILTGLLRTVAALLLAALVVFEIGAVLVNQVQLDGAAQRAAREVASAYDVRPRDAVARRTAEVAAASLGGSSVLEVTVTDGIASVTLARPAPVLLLDRVPALRDRLHGTATARARRGP